MDHIWGIPTTSKGQPASSNMIEFRQQDDLDQKQSSLNRFRIENKLTDVNLIINGKQFPCHRVILAWKSSYFEDMFNKNPSKVIDGNPTLINIGAELFENMLSFMYDNSANCITKENAFYMYKFSNELKMEELQKKAAQFIKNSSLKVDHQVDACKLATEWEDMNLVNAICKRLGKQVHFDELMQKRYKDLPYDIFYTIIKNTELKDENKKADAILKWMNMNALIPSELLLQLLKLVNRENVNYGSLKKLLEEVHRQSAIQNVQVSKNAKRSKSGNRTEGGKASKIAKKSINLPSTSNRLKVFAETFTTDGNHNMNVFAFEDDRWRWLPNEKIDVVCDRLKSVRCNDCDYFLTFQSDSSNSRAKNSFWMVDANGRKKNLASVSTIVKDYRLSVLSGKPVLYDVKCTKKNRSLRWYEVASDKWYCIDETPMLLNNAGVTDYKGLYYFLCGGTTEDGNSNKNAYCCDGRMPRWIDLPEMIHNHDHAVACSLTGKIFVYGGEKNEFEMFDIDAWQWRSLRAKECADVPLFYESEKILVSNGDNLLLMNVDGNVTKYNVKSDTWSPIRSFLTNKFSAVVKDVVVEEWR